LWPAGSVNLVFMVMHTTVTKVVGVFVRFRAPLHC
jgi:hypothetical protein